MTCQYLKDGRCQYAEAAALTEMQLELVCETTEENCQKCLAAGNGQPSLYSLALVNPQIPQARKLEWTKAMNWLLHGKSRGVGDTISKALAMVGITKERVSKAKGKPCNCGKRQSALNRAMPYAS